GFSVGIVRSAQHGDKDLCLPDLTRLRIGYRHCDAGVIDEELLAGEVVLPHRHVDLLAPCAVELAVVAAAVASFGMPLSVLLPEQFKRDALVALELLLHLRPAR